MNAELYREWQDRVSYNGHHQNAVRKLRETSQTLDSLLQIREQLRSELGQAERDALRQRQASAKAKLDAEEDYDESNVRRMSRFRNSNGKLSDDSDTGMNVLHKLINLEKAKQTLNTAKDTLSSTRSTRKSWGSSNEILDRLEHTDSINKRPMRKKTMGISRSKSPILNTRVAAKVVDTPSQSMVMGRLSEQQAKLEDLNRRIRARNGSCMRKREAEEFQAEDMRRSIETIRRSYDSGTIYTAFEDIVPETERPMSPIERRDPFKNVERRRATLAALKLKHRPS